jgi:hypothetical protein
MEKCLSVTILLALGLFAAESHVLLAGSPWASLIPYKRVEADPKKFYALGEEHGPWLILAASFHGQSAEKDARTLVQELRSRYKLPAYIHRQTYDFSQPIEERNGAGPAKKMRYMKSQKYEGLAVLVGNFQSVQDPDLETTLNKIKQLKPATFDPNQSSATTTKLADFSGLKRRLSSNAKGARGPMASAFATRNPLLPDEVLAPNGIDNFVARLNKGVEHSLLDNPGKYTVRVATFRGSATINQREIEDIQTRDKLTDKLQVAADNAHRLTVALRKRGVDAYEFHDRMESIVAVGSFTSEKQISQIYKIVEQFRATEEKDPKTGRVGIKPVTLDGIKCDAEPLPIEVPRRSIAADYARRGFSH